MKYEDCKNCAHLRKKKKKNGWTCTCADAKQKKYHTPIGAIHWCSLK